MRLTYENIIGDLNQVIDRINSDGLNIGTVTHINYKTKFLGIYFAEMLGSTCVEVPSVIRKTRNKNLARIVNSIYPFFPEPILKSLSEKYKKMYIKSERTIPDFPVAEIIGIEDSSVLLVDDNCLTGRTLSMWKEKIEDRTGREVKTFAITVTGNHKPDYFCYEGWHSFEWRPIGI